MHISVVLNFVGYPSTITNAYHQRLKHSLLRFLRDLNRALVDSGWNIYTHDHFHFLNIASSIRVSTRLLSFIRWLYILSYFLLYSSILIYLVLSNSNNSTVYADSSCYKLLCALVCLESFNTRKLEGLRMKPSMHHSKFLLFTKKVPRYREV